MQATAKRYLALDAFRGATVALMILVNTPGSWQHIYAPFKHATWHGCTLTDLVFPFFLFIVGASLALSGKNKTNDVTPSYIQQVGVISKRAVIIFSIGLFLNAFPFDQNIEQLRIMGVLQRIAICYWFASVIVLTASRYQLRFGVIFAIVFILLSYWWILFITGKGDPYSLVGSSVATLDIMLFGANHLWQGLGVPFDPEGLLSSIPAIASVLIGYQATVYLLASQSIAQVVKQFVLVGILLVLFGGIWSMWLPINKSLWTSSYVLFSSGFALMTLALFIYWVDIRQQQKSVSYLIAMGANPLFLYVISWLWVECYWIIAVSENISLYQQLYAWLNILLSAKSASLLFAILHVSLFTYVAIILKKRHIFIKI